MPRLPIAICFAALWTVSAAAKGVPPSQAEARCPPEEISSACAARMIIGGEGLAEELRVGLHGQLTPVSEITLRAALEAYLAERAAWGEQQAWEELAFPILALAAPDETPLVPAQDLEAALGELLDQRQSWGTHSVQVAGAAEPTASPSDTAAALKALLAERESWGTQPAQAGGGAAAAPAQAHTGSADTAAALKALLEERASWGTQPSQATATAAAPVKSDTSGSTTPESNEAALKALLEERASWGTQPSQATATAAAPAKADTSGSTTPESNEAALKALLKERASWGTKPAQATATPAAAPGKAAPAKSATPESNEAALKALLKERASWGTKPSKTAAVSAAPVSTAQDCEAKLRSISAEGTIRFETASATLDAESHPTLDRIAAAAKECGKVGIRVEGHTDDTGTARSNQSLSQQRAQAVAGYLAKAGVEAKRLQATGFGETKPLVANDTAENRAKNRRIEFSVR
jgi:OOP family OmpA-OmpF porin